MAANNQTPQINAPTSFNQALLNTGNWRNRMVIGHPTTGNVRIEWVLARFGQTIPCNWSHVDVVQFMQPTIPLQYQVADAENLLAKSVVETDAEWLLMWEHDNIPPMDALVRLNEYMIDGKVPVVAGVYFTKSVPPEPMVYRELGCGYYPDWRMGDLVWCSGIPFGFTLIHGKIIKAMWAESPEYIVNGQVVRRVFNAPSRHWLDPEKGVYVSEGGTSDLAWCQRVMKEGFFEKAGWPEYQKMQYPFLIDTNIYVHHIDEHGRRFPLELPKRYAPDGPAREHPQTGKPRPYHRPAV
jgi:hypothetical protein